MLKKISFIIFGIIILTVLIYLTIWSCTPLVSKIPM